jgi:hypothetical protein
MFMAKYKNDFLELDALYGVHEAVKMFTTEISTVFRALGWREREGCGCKKFSTTVVNSPQ